MQFSGYVKKILPLVTVLLYFYRPCYCFVVFLPFMPNNLVCFSFYLSVISSYTHTHTHTHTHTPSQSSYLVIKSVFILWSFWALILGYTDTFTIWGSRFETRTLDFGLWGLKPSQRLYFEFFFIQLTNINGYGSMNKYMTIYY